MQHLVQVGGSVVVSSDSGPPRSLKRVWSACAALPLQQVSGIFLSATGKNQQEPMSRLCRDIVSGCLGIGHVSTETLCRECYRTERKENNSGSEEQLRGGNRVLKNKCSMSLENTTHSRLMLAGLLIGNTPPSWVAYRLPPIIRPTRSLWW
jgi:hypothetical protein